MSVGNVEFIYGFRSVGKNLYIILIFVVVNKSYVDEFSQMVWLDRLM